jgi:hypothetical protein
VHAARARRPGTIIADVRNDLADAAALAVTDEPLLRQVVYPAAFRVDKQVDWNPPRRTQVRRASTVRSTAKKPMAKKPAATPN